MIAELDLPSYARKPAWHGKGITTIGRDLTDLEVRKSVGANEWSAESVGGFIPYHADGPLAGRPWIPHNGEAPPANILWARTEAKFNVRSDLPLSDPRSLLSPRGVGEGYELVQYDVLADLAAVAIQESGGTYEAAGTLENGRKGWVLVKLDTPIKVAGGDVVNTYLLFSNAHDGTRAVTVSPTSIRVVCWNTLSAAWAEADQRLHHTSNVGERIEDVKRVLKTASASFEKLGAQYNSMAKQAIDDRLAAALLFALYPNPKPTKENPNPSKARAEKKRNSIWTLFQGKQAGADGPGMVTSDGKRTEYAMLNALTEYQTHVKVRRSTGDGSKAERSELVLERSIINGGQDQLERERMIATIERNLGLAPEVDRDWSTNTGVDIPTVDALMDQIAIA